MRRIAICMVTGLFVISFACALSGCDESQNDSAVGSAGVVSTQQQADDVEETDYFKVEGVYEDSSYKSKEKKDLKLIYVFYRIRALDEAVSADAGSMTMTIGTNTYNATHVYSDDANFFSSYYASDTPKDVSSGDSLKCVTNYLVSESDLADGNAMTFAYDKVPDIASIHIDTGNVVACNNGEKIAKKADAKGYKLEVSKRKVATSSVGEDVAAAINGRSWEFSASSQDQKIEFSVPDKYVVTTSDGSAEGTYTVCSGYIKLESSNAKHVNWVAYTLDGDEITLEFADWFDV